MVYKYCDRVLAFPDLQEIGKLFKTNGNARVKLH